MNDREILDALAAIPRDMVTARDKLYSVWYSPTRSKNCIISPDGGIFTPEWEQQIHDNLNNYGIN